MEYKIKSSSVFYYKNHKVTKFFLDIDKEVREIEISRIVDFPNNSLKILYDDNYKELEESIKENGVLVPITIRINSNGKFEYMVDSKLQRAI